MSGPRIFTVEEANATLPRLRVLVAQQIERADQIERLLGRVRELSRLPSEAEGRAELEQRLEALVAAYEEGWREVESTGAVVKDPRIGLLDFYGKVDGNLVWLCWRYGEETVAHYHALEAGFSGRKPLEGAPVRALLN